MDEIGGYAFAEHDLVDTAGIGDAVAAVTDAELVAVIAEPAFESVLACPAGQHIVAVVETDQMVVGSGAGQHAVDDGFNGQNSPVGEFELLDAAGRQAVDDGQDVEAAAEIDEEIIAIAGGDDVLEANGGAEHHAIDDARRVRPLDDAVEAIAGRERIGIGAVAAVKRVVALAPVQHVLLVEQARNDIVAAVTAGDLQQLLDVRDLDGGAVEEAEQLDAVLGVAELIADA